MPTLIKDKGRSKSPSFYTAASGSLKSSASGVKSNLPLFAVLILGGVAVIFILRNKSGASQAGGIAGAPLTVSPSNESDISAIQNMIQAITALQGNHPVTPSGGVSTPITKQPTTPVEERGHTPEEGWYGPGGTGVPGQPVINPGAIGSSDPRNYQYPSIPPGWVSTQLGPNQWSGPNPNQILDRVNGAITGNINTNSRQGAGVPANIQTVGPLTYPAGLTPQQTAEANAVNMSLTDWVIHTYQTTGTFQGLYGPNAGASQQALDSAAIAEARRRVAAGTY